jgi:hypothetical protein
MTAVSVARSASIVTSGSLGSERPTWIVEASSTPIEYTSSAMRTR